MVTTTCLFQSPGRNPFLQIAGWWHFPRLRGRTSDHQWQRLLALLEPVSVREKPVWQLWNIHIGFSVIYFLIIYLSVHKHKHIYIDTLFCTVSHFMDLFIRSTWISHASQGSVPSSCLQSMLPQLTGRMRISLQCRSRKTSPMEHWARKRKKNLCHKHANTHRENNCLKVASIASHQNPNSLRKDNAFRVTLLLSHALMAVEWNKQSVLESSPNQSARQHKEWYYWVAKSFKFLYYRFQRLTGGNGLGKQRKEKKRGICRALRDNRFPVSAWLFSSCFVFLWTKYELNLKLLEICLWSAMVRLSVASLVLFRVTLWGPNFHLSAVCISRGL